MSQLAAWLRSGDLRSDGLADEAVRLIVQNHDLLPELLAALDAPEPVLRAHAADAIEKLGRTRPELLRPHAEDLIARARQDQPAAVLMHLAMLFGHLALYADLRPALLAALLDLLRKPGAFTRSWAVSSLCILARLEPGQLESILPAIRSQDAGTSAAVRARVRKALPLLTNPAARFPPGWVKCEQLQFLVRGPTGPTALSAERCTCSPNS